MKKNLAYWDRSLRVLGAALAVGIAFLSSLPLVVQAVLGLSAAYLLWSSLAGTCLGYRLLGMSSCPREST